MKPGESDIIAKRLWRLEDLAKNIIQEIQELKDFVELVDTRSEAEKDILDRSCKGKKSYKTEVDAGQAAEHHRQARGVELRIYQCPNCKEFHLTKTTLENLVK